MQARSFVLVAALLVGAASVLCLANPARATTYYFDVNGSAAGSGVADNGSYNWLTDSNWSTDPTGNSATSSAPFTYTGNASDGDSAVFVAGSDAGSDAFTVNVNGFMGVHNMDVNSGNLTINTWNTNWVLNASSTRTIRRPGPSPPAPV